MRAQIQFFCFLAILHEGKEGLLTDKEHAACSARLGQPVLAPLVGPRMHEPVSHHHACHHELKAGQEAVLKVSTGPEIVEIPCGLRRNFKICNHY